LLSIWFGADFERCGPSIGYHLRSRAETKMNCDKRLGQGIMARDLDRQVAELHIQILLNGLRGEDSIFELCCREVISQGI